MIKAMKKDGYSYGLYGAQPKPIYKNVFKKNTVQFIKMYSCIQHILHPLQHDNGVRTHTKGVWTTHSLYKYNVKY